MSLSFSQAAQEGIYLRFAETITPQRELSYEAAINMLLRGLAMAQTVPFSWAFVDKPMDGTILLLFYPHNTPMIDGIRYQEPEVKFTIPAGTRELEVAEAKYGFIPSFGESNASRMRRRYRLSKGGNPQLMLVHYTRGPPTHIQPALMNQLARPSPIRPITEPPMYVAGEKMGQKVYPPGVGPMHGGPSSMVPPTIGMGMNFNQQQAMLAQQNNNMEVLEQRRRERERQQQQERAAQRPPPQRMVEDDDSGDEVDSISTRTLALARYKRNHDWMNDVFNQAAFGKRTIPPKPSPYSIFNKTEIAAKTAKLQAELDALQAKSAQRRADKIREAQIGGDVVMGSVGESITV